MQNKIQTVGLSGGRFDKQITLHMSWNMMYILSFVKELKIWAKSPNHYFAHVTPSHAYNYVDRNHNVSLNCIEVIIYSLHETDFYLICFGGT